MLDFIVAGGLFFERNKWIFVRVSVAIGGKLRVLLIQPSCLVTERWSHNAQPFLSLGLGCIGAVLRDQGHEVSVLDALTEGWEFRWRIEGRWIEIGLAEEDVAAEIRHKRPQVVGFSIPLITQMPRLRSLARWVKAIHPEIFVVCGGAHAGTVPREVLAIPEVDLVVLGEGERTFSQVLERLAADGDFDGLNGIALRDENGAVEIRPATNYVENLDDLPLPAYDLLPLKKYFKAMGERILPVFTTRGCLNACAHCTTPSVHGAQIRRVSLPVMTQRIGYLMEYYGVRDFLFDDHGRFADREDAKNFFAGLASVDYKFNWTARNGVDPRILDEELLLLMKKSGGKRLHFAADSGSRRVLRNCLQKPYNPYEVEKGVERAVKAGLNVTAHFLIGIPGETVEEIYETLNFAWKLRSLGVDEFEFSLAVPFPGTALHRWARVMGVGLPEQEPMYNPHDGGVSTNEVSLEELIRIRDSAQREFNSRGLVFNLKEKIAPWKKEKPEAEERFFYSVAPQSVAYDRRWETAEPETQSEEIT